MIITIGAESFLSTIDIVSLNNFWQIAVHQMFSPWQIMFSWNKEFLDSDSEKDS
jgi:hypothetical protein